MTGRDPEVSVFLSGSRNRRTQAAVRSERSSQAPCRMVGANHRAPRPPESGQLRHNLSFRQGALAQDRPCKAPNGSRSKDRPNLGGHPCKLKWLLVLRARELTRQVERQRRDRRRPLLEEPTRCASAIGPAMAMRMRSLRRSSFVSARAQKSTSDSSPSRTPPLSFRPSDTPASTWPASWCALASSLW